MNTTRTAFVTGGNRGLGLEVSRRLAKDGLRVILAVRDEAAGEEAAETLLRGGAKDVRVEVIDASDEASIEACARRLDEARIAVDILVNNAAIYPSGQLVSVDWDTIDEVVRTNVYGPIRLARSFMPAMIARGYGRVVNVSSGSGSFGEGLPGPDPYCFSKASLNAATVCLARDVPSGVDVKVNSVCPGWVRTRMGGPSATRSVEEGADGIVWLAQLPADGPTGGFFRDRRPIEW